MIAWLFTTKLGRIILLVGLSLVVVGLSWWAFSSHYDRVGYDRCQSEHAKALAEANARQAEENTRKNEVSSAIAAESASSSEELRAAADISTAETKEVIRYVYRDRPATAPVRPLSCAHPVDPRVQRELDEALRRANEAGGPL